jgi:hypothetical protein
MSIVVALAFVVAAIILLAIGEAGYRLWCKMHEHPEDFEQQ